MCYSCGCLQSANDHGDVRNLTTLHMRGAAEAAGITVPEVVGNVARTLALHRGRQRSAQKSAGDQIAHGTVLKADEENRFLLLVAYSANKMPVRGADGFVDVASPDVLEKACWRFMDNGAKVGLWHEAGHDGAARVVENYIYRNDVPWVMKRPDGSSQIVQHGDWLFGAICSHETWALYKAGLIGGASPQGRAGRRPASPDLLARMRTE